MKKIALIALLLSIGWAVAGETACRAEWYVRGGIAYEQSLDADFSDEDSGATDPPALFGTGVGGDGKPLGARGDFGAYPVLELALGRQITPWLRSEGIAQYRFNMTYGGNANFLGVGSNQPVSASADSLCGLVSLFVDVDGLVDMAGPFHPYFGGGLGLAYNRVEEISLRFPGNSGRHKLSVVPAGDRKEVATLIAAGTGVVLSRALLLDVSYRYQDLGRIGTDRGLMVMDVLPSGIEIGEISAPLRTHGLSLSLCCRF